MLFDAIFLAIFLAGWLICAYVPWVAYSVATRGNAGMPMLPLCLLVGVVAALAVPVLGFTGRGGLIASFPAAFAGSAAIMALRRATLPAGARTPEEPPEAG